MITIHALPYDPSLISTHMPNDILPGMVSPSNPINTQAEVVDVEFDSEPVKEAGIFSSLGNLPMSYWLVIGGITIVTGVIAYYKFR